MKNKKNIFIGLSGLTPQVITETLYCLAVKEKKVIETIYVITTQKGLEIIEGKTSLPALAEEIQRMKKKYKIDLPLFDPSIHVLMAKEDYELLEDVRTNKENELFPNFIVDFIRQQSNGQTRLLCGLSGGRKTMSVAMAFALSLHGRSDDKLYHVIANPEFEATKKFFPESKHEQNMLVLSEVPYVRLRDKLNDDPLYQKNTYMDMVEEAQRQIGNLLKLPECILDIQRRKLLIEEKEIPLQPFEMAIYLFFMEQKNPLRGGKGMEPASLQRIEEIYHQIVPRSAHSERIRQTLKNSGFATLCKNIAQINRKIKETVGTKLCSHYSIVRTGAYAAKEYYIPLDRKLFKKIK